MTQPRENELTAVLGRSAFDAYPAGCDSERDRRRWAAFRAAYHAAQRLDATADFPLQLDLELNSHCQMRCSFCIHGQTTVKKQALPKALFLRAIDEGRDHGLCSVKFNYINEPLLNPDLVEQVLYARSRGVLNTYFATNGILLDETISARLIDARLSKVMVSLDATTPGTFKRMRNSDRFDLIQRNVAGLLETRRRLGAWWPIVRVNFLRTRINGHEADDFRARWEGVADSVGFQSQVGLPGVEDELEGAGHRRAFRCSFPSKQLVIDSSGDILPCCTFSGRSMPLGNLADMTLSEAWASKKMRDLRQLHRSGSGLSNPICAHCISGK